MTDLWIAYEAAARGIARQRRGKGEVEKNPTDGERLLARIAVDEALPYLPGAPAPIDEDSH